MDDYVDRMELRNALYDADAITMRGVKILNQFPTADVRPVVRGRWVINNGRWCCDKCTCQAVIIRSPFCPNCGADMRMEG